MEDPANTGGGDDPPSNHSFGQAMAAAHEIDDLESAIECAKELDNAALPILKRLKELRGSLAACGHQEQVKMEKLSADTGAGSDPRNGTLNRNLAEVGVLTEEREDIETFEGFYGTFEGTGNVIYLDSAIGLTEQLVASASLDEKRQCALSLLRELLKARCSRTEGPKGLEQVIKLVEKVVAATPPGHPDREKVLRNLCESLLKRYERFGALEDLEEVIKLVEEALATTPPDQPDRATMLDNLGSFFGSRYDRLGDLKDLEQAITWGKEAVAAAPTDNPDRAAMLNNLGKNIGSRFDRLGDLQDLEQAIEQGEEALAATPPDHPNRATMLDNLGRYVGGRYGRLGDLQDLGQAIKLGEEAITETPPDHPDLAGRLSNLGNMICSRYDRLGDLKDLEQAIIRNEEAAAAIPPDHPKRVRIVSNLAALTRRRYDRLGNLQDLEQAIKRAEEAVAAIPLDHPNRAAMLNNLANTIGSRYDRLGDLQDLEQAINMAEEVVAATPLDHPNFAGRLNNFGCRIASRYNRLGNLKDLEQAIYRCEEAVAAMPPDHPNRAHILDSLGSVIDSRYRRFGDLQDLEESIKLVKEATAATPPDHPRLAAMLNNLGGSMKKRYDRLGDLQDLEQAISRVEEAVTATPLDHPDSAVMLCNLGCWIRIRYERLGDLQDLDQAIKLSGEAVAATPLDHPMRAMRLSNLGSWIGIRYDRLGDLEDLEQTIKRVGEAVAATPLDSPSRAGMLNNLGYSIGRRYRRLGDLQDLEQAIKLSREAVAATPLDHPDCAIRLFNLGLLIGTRYDRLEDLQDLQQAISQTEAAVAATPSDCPERAFFLKGLIDLLILEYQKSDSIQRFNYILRISYEAWHSRVSPPQFRIKVAHKASLFLAARKMWQESSSLLEGAVKMLPELSSRSLQRHDQEYRLSDFTQLAAETASVAFQAGEGAAHGLRFLELGRGIIMGLAIDCRSDNSELRSIHPEVFNKFDRLRIEVDSPPKIPPPLEGIEKENRESTYQQGRRRREQAVHDLEETLASIRELPGFEGFQLPPCSDDLMAMAGEGPIVIFNSTTFRSDAIIVTSSAIKALALPKLIYESAKERMSQMAQLVRGRRSTYVRRNEEFEEILLWLWNVAVEPVFESLQLDTVVHDGDLPRVWWIGVGLLAKAPFHAAGDHSPRSTRNTLSRAISSYIPTIKALSYTRQRKLQLLSRPDTRLLLVTMPTTPGHRRLKNATKEAEEILDVVKGKTNPTRLDHPSTAQVLMELPSHHAIHFACHGISDGKSPSNSHLLLCKDGSESGILDRLTVGTISNMNIKHAQIAYLSACSTAENASSELADESIYIASGFQLAGFSHVLATQWVSNDEACRQVAGDFYRFLFSNQPGGDKEGHQKVSAAFHYSVRKLRNEIPRQPIKWAPYIHTGA